MGIKSKVFHSDKGKYGATVIGIEHNQSIALINEESGEVSQIKISKPRKNKDLEPAPSLEVFQKHYTNAWKLLITQLSDKEFIVAYKLGIMAKAYTNSIEPLNDDTTALELSSVLSVDRRYVHKITDKLFRLGVIAKFECYNGSIHSRYWIFNPFLMFNGKMIQKDIPNLFIDTVYAKV